MASHLPEQPKRIGPQLIVGGTIVLLIALVFLLAARYLLFTQAGSTRPSSFIEELETRNRLARTLATVDIFAGVVSVAGLGLVVCGLVLFLRSRRVHQRPRSEATVPTGEEAHPESSGLSHPEQAPDVCEKRRLKPWFVGLLLVGVVLLAGLCALAFRSKVEGPPPARPGEVKAATADVALAIVEQTMDTHDLGLSFGGYDGMRVKHLREELMKRLSGIEGLSAWAPVAIKAAEGDYVGEMARRDKITSGSSLWGKLEVFCRDDAGNIVRSSVPLAYCTARWLRPKNHILPRRPFRWREEDGRRMLYVDDRPWVVPAGPFGPAASGFSVRTESEVLVILPGRRGAVLSQPGTVNLLATLIGEGYTDLLPYWLEVTGQWRR